MANTRGGASKAAKAAAPSAPATKVAETVTVPAQAGTTDLDFSDLGDVEGTSASAWKDVPAPVLEFVKRAISEGKRFVPTEGRSEEWVAEFVKHVRNARPQVGADRIRVSNAAQAGKRGLSVKVVMPGAADSEDDGADE